MLDRLARNYAAVIGPLRTGQGVDPSGFEALCASLRECGASWAGSDMIPKAAAAILVDILPAFEECESLYQGEDLARVGAASMTISDLLIEILNDDHAGPVPATEGSPPAPKTGPGRRKPTGARGGQKRPTTQQAKEPGPETPPAIDSPGRSSIVRFEGDYAFLSNFWSSPLTLDGITFPTVEHAFQASKTFDAEERVRVALATTPGVAKRAGRKVTLRPDWEQVKVGIMEDLVRRKFADPELSAKLLATGALELIEGNTWNDRFWGVCRGSGRNELGKILMRVRSELVAARSS